MVLQSSELWIRIRKIVFGKIGSKIRKTLLAKTRMLTHTTTMRIVIPKKLNLNGFDYFYFERVSALMGIVITLKLITAIKMMVPQIKMIGLQNTMIFLANKMMIL